MEQDFEIVDLAELELFVATLAQELKPLAEKDGYTIGLSGEMGAGKTTFVRTLAEQFGIVGQVSSPSYVLQYEYEAENLVIDHWDVYRVDQPPEELWEQVSPGTLRLVEWSNKFPELDTIDMEIRIEFLSEQTEASSDKRKVYVVKK